MKKCLNDMNLFDAARTCIELMHSITYSGVGKLRKNELSTKALGFSQHMFFVQLLFSIAHNAIAFGSYSIYNHVSIKCFGFCQHMFFVQLVISISHNA